MPGMVDTNRIPCWKVPYDSLGEARRAMRGVQRKHTKDANTRRRMEAYKCPHCHRYHYGHTPRYALGERRGDCND